MFLNVNNGIEIHKNKFSLRCISCNDFVAWCWISIDPGYLAGDVNGHLKVVLNNYKRNYCYGRC